MCIGRGRCKCISYYCGLWQNSGSQISLGPGFSSATYLLILWHYLWVREELSELVEIKCYIVKPQRVFFFWLVFVYLFLKRLGSKSPVISVSGMTTVLLIYIHFFTLCLFEPTSVMSPDVIVNHRDIILVCEV